jgi:predicted RNA binding protein YcfA (HicA-like mRNA interferase family)
MKVREVIALIEADGWPRVYTRGSHRQYKHPTNRERVTVADHPGDYVHPKTLRSIMRQAGLQGGEG